MKMLIYISAAVAVITAIVVNMLLTVDYNVAKIYAAWENKRVEYDNCFKAFGIADIQVEAIIDRWSVWSLAMEDKCVVPQLQRLRYDILSGGNAFISVISERNAHLCMMEEELLAKGMPI